jgi:MoxR-like ATPase
MRFTRVQFTPDLMPADVTGSSIFDQRTSDFEFRPGPIFTNLLLADEINRAPPKTQAALLEAMQERQVTIEGDAGRSSGRSSCSRRRTRSSTRAPTRCRRRSSTASCCACGSATRRATTSGDPRAAARARRGRVELEPGRRRETLLAMQRASRTSTSPSSLGPTSSTSSRRRGEPALQVGASPRGSLALLKLARCRARCTAATSRRRTTSRRSPSRRSAHR